MRMIWKRSLRHGSLTVCASSTLRLSTIWSRSSHSTMTCWGILLHLIPTLRFWSPRAHHRQLAIRFDIVTDEHHDVLIAEFQDYLLMNTADSRVDTFWVQMARKKTFTGGMRFPYLADLMTTMSVIANNNPDSERVFSMCHKIDTDARSQLGFHVKSTWMSRAMHFSMICWNRQSLQHGTIWKTTSDSDV